ncbi:MAG: gamma-glutamylcyclotransferase family protein [Planctomycetota bacterium]
MPHAYFAYGSNLDPVQMKRRCPSSTRVGRAVLADHRLVFPLRSDGDWNGGVAGIEPVAPSGGRDAHSDDDPNAHVHGVVYTIDDADLAALDRYEAVDEGMYRRERIGVVLDDGRRAEVLTYFAIADPAGPTPPSKKYLGAILRGATHHGLPAAYLQHLAAIRTLD